MKKTKRWILIIAGLIFFLIVPKFAVPINLVRKARDGTISDYLKSLWLAKDQACKVALYGGNPDTTVSHQVGVHSVAKKTNWAERRICCILRLLDENHCVKSIEKDEL